MHLRDTIEMDATPEEVWPFVADPVLISAWNPRIVDVRREHDGPVERGERFGMVYRMGGRDRPARVDVIACRAPVQVIYRCHLTGEGRERFADERYELARRGDRTRLVQAIDLGGLGIPWPVRLLMSFIHRTGRPVGERYLEHLARLVAETSGRG